MSEVRVKKVDRVKQGLWEKSYIPEIARGLSVTMKHFFTNLNPNKEKRSTLTREYPEQPADYYPERFRGMHRLMVRDDGNVRCVACMCCSTICPADCIHIEAAEHDDPNIEKYPKVFVIDELRCIVCGLCVEACPCDAIRMDSGVHVHPFTDRGEAFYERDLLMELGGLSMAKQGGERT
ncbi:MAG: NuoI/complex I 23 kDa subunit family protein [Persicimonas sp.]